METTRSRIDVVDYYYLLLFLLVSNYLTVLITSFHANNQKRVVNNITVNIIP